MEQKQTSKIKELARELVSTGLVIVLTNNEFRFTNKFYQIAGGLENPVKKDELTIPIRIPQGVVELKNLYKPVINDTRTLSKLYLLGKPIFQQFIYDLFGKDKYAPHKVQKKDSNMMVSSYSDEGMKAFSLALSTPGVEYLKLFASAILAYKYRVGFETRTIGNFFISGMWKGFYEEINSMDDFMKLFNKGDSFIDPDKNKDNIKDELI